MYQRACWWLFPIAILSACSGSSGGSSGTTGSPGNPDAPEISAFAAAPSLLHAPGSVTLSWSVTKATTLSIDQGVGVVSGSSVDVQVSKATTFTLTATNAAGSVTRSVQVLLDSRVAPPVIASFTGTPTNVPFGGGNVTLSWSTTNATTLSIDQGVGEVSGTSIAVQVTASTTFTLTATGAGQSVTAIASVVVGEQLPPPTIQSFTASPMTLPALGGDVTLTWSTTGATSLSIDQGVGAVTGVSTMAPVTASTTFTLTATNTSGNATATATVTVAVDVDRYADSTNGDDTNDCSHDAPCKTIISALAAAKSGTTVHLFDGTFGTANQGARTINIPDGIGLSAINPGAAVLTNMQIVATGSTSISGLVFDLELFSCSSLTAKSTTGTPTLTLSGVLFKCMDAVAVGGNVQATMAPGALVGGLYTSTLPNGYDPLISLTDNAQLVIQGGIIDGNNVGAPAFGGGLIAVLNNAQLTLDGATIQNRTEVGILADGNGAIVLKNQSVISKVGTAGGDCPTGAAIVLSGVNSLSIDSTQMTTLTDGAICVRNTSNLATITVTNTTIDGSADGIVAEIGTGSLAAVTIDSSSINNGGYGINWSGLSGSSFSVTNSTFQGNQTAVSFNGTGATFTMRDSNILNSTTDGIIAYGGATIDLGTTASPGGNVLTGNAGANLTTNLDPGNDSATAIGNTWDAGVQGADVDGHYSVAPDYAAVVEQGPLSGGNFSIANATPLSL